MDRDRGILRGVSALKLWGLNAKTGKAQSRASAA
jgi:hypothetical protein